MTNPTPVITIDGPTASGKGTIALELAKKLGWHILDSGMLYRLSALAVIRQGIDSDNEKAITDLVSQLKIQFVDGQVLLDNDDVSEIIRQEEVGNMASKIAVFPSFRQALLALQRNFRQAPGLVADGRDMGSVVFTDADLKIFLQADVQVRAQRRYKQLIDKGISAKLESLLNDLKERDLRDQNRAAAPLIVAPGAKVIDATYLSIEQTVDKVLFYWQQCKN